jgi:uncharacterized protein YbgA (DUF1722 family)/uncharacterized protein YbbK (DUF523 family)
MKLTDFALPKVIVSRCIEFEPCRYNAQMISSDFVEKLGRFVEFSPVCPECEIGLGVPREAVRLISHEGAERLLQPATKRDVTEEMEDFAQSFLGSLKVVDGFILKAGSPSCGIRNTRIYLREGNVAPISKTATGVFGKAVLGKFPYLAIEDEGRLKNERIREHFLIKLFTLTNFRKVLASGSFNELISFHARNKLLLMSYSQAGTNILGNVVANRNGKPFAELAVDYQVQLYKVFSRARRYTSNVNVLMHALGYFSDLLSRGEKALFLDNIQKYRDGKVSICPNTILLRSWSIRFEDKYLMDQTFFEPYPSELMEVDPVTSHLGRDLWRQSKSSDIG